MQRRITVLLINIFASILICGCSSELNANEMVTYDETVETESLYEIETEEVILQEKQTNSEAEDEFVEVWLLIYPTEPVVFYDAPNKNANVIMEMEGYDEIYLEAYNEKTDWYSISYMYDETIYCRVDEYLTPEEYSAILNQGVEEKYFSLKCVDEPLKYSKTPIGIIIDDDSNLACVHMKGKHNFVTPEIANRCSETMYVKLVEWRDMTHAAINNDGTVNLYSRETIVPQIITMEEYDEKYRNAGVVLYESFDAYMRTKDQYLEDAMYEIINER